MRPRVPNDELHRRRHARRWSQHQLAHQVNRLMAADGLAPTCAAKRVGRWERGEAVPEVRDLGERLLTGAVAARRSHHSRHIGRRNVPDCMAER